MKENEICNPTHNKGVYNMIQDSELSRLERFVEKMMKRFSELRDDKAQLLKDLGERDQIIEELRSNLSTRDSERGEMSQRVSKIVEQIEEWERTLEEEQGQDVVEQGVESSGVVDSVGAVDDLEDEGRVQHNLFTVASPEK
jgi:chromosome segregation ATPase